jgi:hypothetical protein
VVNICETVLLYSNVTNMARIHDFEFISDKFKVIEMYTNGNLTQKWVTKLYNCTFRVHCYLDSIFKKECWNNIQRLVSQNYLHGAESFLRTGQTLS